MKENNLKSLFDFDESYKKYIIGTDEAGRGPAAGGVFASAVYFPSDSKKIQDRLSILNDSKQLSASKREYLYDIILNETINETVCVEVDEIEKYNILASSLKAMRISCNAIIAKVEKDDIIVLVDGNKLIRDFDFPQQYVIKGDAKSASIAAESILAKVSRDRYMKSLHEEFPQYNWIKNAGYLTKEHFAAIDKYGLTKYHRKSFLRKHFEKQLTLF